MEDVCVCCGTSVPEGTMVCNNCVDKTFGVEYLPPTIRTMPRNEMLTFVLNHQS